MPLRLEIVVVVVVVVVGVERVVMVISVRVTVVAVAMIVVVVVGKAEVVEAIAAMRVVGIRRVTRKGKPIDPLPLPHFAAPILSCFLPC